jgi:hypothetical protein
MVCSQKALYRDTRKTHKTLCQDGKNRAMLRSFRLVPGLYPDLASLLQPSLAQQRLHPLLPGR